MNLTRAFLIVFWIALVLMAGFAANAIHLLVSGPADLRGGFIFNLATIVVGVAFMIWCRWVIFYLDDPTRRRKK